MTNLTASDGPQDTPALAYLHAAELASAVAASAIRTSPLGPAWVRAERVEHLAAELAAQAKEAST